VVDPDRLVRIGVVGTGGIAQVSHLPSFQRIPGAKVTAVCDNDLSKARRVASRYNVPHVTESFEELAGMDEVDAVVICLPNHLHLPAAVAALRAGKHVLCERPFSRSLDEAQEMVAAAKKHQRILMGGFNNRFREDAVVLKSFLTGGELGPVFYVKTGWLMQASTWSGAGWRKKRDLTGGGVLLDLGIQMLDLALWLLDMPAVAAVSAALYPKPAADNLESTASALLRLAAGGTMALEVSWGLLMERDFAYVNLFGPQGAALLNPLRLHKEMHGNLVNVTPTLSSPRNTYKMSYEAEIRHFVECVQTGSVPIAPGDEAVVLHEILDAMYRSASEGCEVRLG
jgi:predicted dehydrogenase